MKTYKIYLGGFYIGTTNYTLQEVRKIEAEGFILIPQKKGRIG